jgi:hypothetical protein
MQVGSNGGHGTVDEASAVVEFLRSLRIEGTFVAEALAEAE